MSFSGDVLYSSVFLSVCLPFTVNKDAFHFLWAERAKKLEAKFVTCDRTFVWSFECAVTCVHLHDTMYHTMFNYKMQG